MRLLRAAVAAGVLAAQPSLAGSILYATAASQRRVDSFCLAPNGSLAPTPKEHVPLGNIQPRRLRVASFAGGQVLYVAQLNRIEAFSIGRHGGLSRLGTTPPAPGMDPRDMVIDTERLKLYVAQRGFNRLVAYPLDAEGRPLPPTDEFPNGFTSCIQGFVPAGYQELGLEAARGLLYVSADGIRGRVEVHRLGSADGAFIAKDENGIDGPVLPPQCKRTFRTNRPPRTTPFSEHTGVSQPKGIILVDDMLYVEDRAARRLVAFQLAPDGTFCPPSPIPRGEEKNFGEDAKCGGFHPLKAERCAEREMRRGRRQQCPASLTNSVFGYERITRHGDTIIGTGFLRGRIDTYHLRPGGLLPRGPSGPSSVDVLMTPIGLVTNGPADDGILYVAAGEFDRVIAFDLDPNGRLSSSTPFSSTNEQKGSFPNDVAIAVLPDSCQ